MKGEAVQHPKHYQHPSGVECIDVIRHYTCDIANAIKYCWRAGLKSESGMTVSEKEAEDCLKAVWYLKDYLRHGISVRRRLLVTFPPHPSGIDCESVASCYAGDVGNAIRDLWWVGLVVDGSLVRVKGERGRVLQAIACLERHATEMASQQNAR